MPRDRAQETTGTNVEDPVAARGPMTDNQDEDRDADLAVAERNDGAT